VTIVASTEEIEPGRWLATAEDYPGARGYGRSEDEAIGSLSDAVFWMRDAVVAKPALRGLP
jgi:hypothetical protein